MADVVSPEKRSKMMSGIRAFDTKPELLIRRGLHAEGFRFRLHSKTLPGKPDLVFPKYHAAIFVNGCFWHRHECSLFKMPSTRPDFWAAKLARNVQRDAMVAEELSCLGWRCLVIWECALRGKGKLGNEQTLKDAKQWLLSGTSDMEIRGTL